MGLVQHAPFTTDRIMVRPAEPVREFRFKGSDYALSSDCARRLVRVEIIGFWSDDMVGKFARDLLSEVRKVDAGDNNHLILGDLTRAVIQSRNVFDDFRELLIHGPTHARKLALFTDNLAMRMQAKRVVGARDTMAIWSNEAEAMAWLFAKGDA